MDGAGTVVRVVTLVAAVGAGLNGGVFYSFSTFTMAGLRDAAPATGIAAMQSINRTAPQPPFMALFLGTAVTCVAVGVAAVLDWGERAATFAVLGALAYLGAIGLTAAYHIPRNDALAALDAGSADAAAYWQRYLREWVRGNHLRTLLCAAGAVLLTFSWHEQA